MESSTYAVAPVRAPRQRQQQVRRRVASGPFLSTLPPSRTDRRLAFGALLASALFFLVVAPYAKEPLARVPAFLPAYQSALLLCDLMTAALLLGQYRIVRTRALLLLACGYLFCAMMAVAHAASFPGLFAPNGVLGGGSQTTAWIYFLWHAGFPLFAAGYAWTKHDTRRFASRRVVWLAAALTIALVAALTLLASAGVELLPPLMQGDRDAPGKAMVAAITWSIGVAAVALVWARKPHSVLDLWLMVVLCAWVFDSALAAVLNHARYDLGWYVGRVYGLLAASFVLGVLLLENAMLHARLAVAAAQLEETNRDLDAFAAALAHDLQQPITSIGSFAQVVRARGGPVLSPTDAAYLDRISAAASNAQAMIRGLLEFARLGKRSLRMEEVDLAAVVRDARDALANELEHREVAWNVAPLPRVRGDRALLQLAFVNLLSNSIKYTRGGGPARIDIAYRLVPGPAHCIVVSDNGVGFDMAEAQQLFAPFERLHTALRFEGTGMGLANVRRIVERHGGTIAAQSAPGAGAAFTLTLPA